MAKSYSMLGKILYAEDDFLTREIVGEKLEEEGYAVVLAKDGKEAWNEFQQNVFDAVILDVDIPVYNGYEVASLIQSENLQIPLIFYSSLTDFFQAIPVNLCRVNAVLVLGKLVKIRFRYSKHFALFVALPNGFGVLLHCRSVAPEKSQSLRVIDFPVEVGKEIGKRVGIVIYPHKLAGVFLRRWDGL